MLAFAVKCSMLNDVEKQPCSLTWSVSVVQVQASPQLSPVEALWFMDLHRSSSDRHLTQQATIANTSQTDLSTAFLQYQQHSPLAIVTSHTSHLSSNTISPSSHSRRSDHFLSVPKPIRRHNRSKSPGRLNYVQLDFDIASINSDQLDCPVCPYKANVNSRLKEHIRQHTGERPYVCNVCSKGFGRKTHLDTHMVIHSGEKPFKCNLCSYSATQKGNLKIHMQSHTGEKPYACMYCDYKAAQKLTLRLHMHNKHPESRTNSD